MRTVEFPHRDVWLLEKQGALENMMGPDERIIHVAGISGGIYWKSIGLLLLGLFALAYGTGLGIMFLSIGAGMFLVMYLTRKYLILAATDRRVIICAGILNQEVFQFPYRRIESVEVLRSLPGQIFGYTNVIIAGTGRRRVIVPFVQDGITFTEDLSRMLLSKDDETVIPPEPLPLTTGEII